MSKKGGLLVVLGTLIGFTSGMLLAPKKGSDLREDAKEKFEDIKENPKKALDNVVGSVKEKINNLTDDMPDDDIEVSDEDIVISRTFDDDIEEEL